MNAPVSLPVPAQGTAVNTTPREETKHEKFLRLADSRVKRTLDDMRMICSLTSKSYEHTPQEAQVIIEVLSKTVHEVAKTFSVPFTAKVGKAGTIGEISVFADKGMKAPVETSKVKIQVAKALDLLKKHEFAAAEEILTDLL
jgi:hypothetical protein